MGAMRAARAEDLPAVDSVFRDAIRDMNRNGIPQWDEIYPTPETLHADYEKGDLYVSEDGNGKVVAAVVINADCNPDCRGDYAAASWQGGEPYLIVHRLCVSPSAQGKGTGRALMADVEAWARERGYVDIRLDAFSLNPHALRMYDRLGYRKRGEANWRKGLFYLLEKQLT